MSENDHMLFEDLAINHMDFLYANAMKLAKNAKGAEDLVQQTYASAYGSFEQFDKNSDFNSWLNEILLMICTNAQANPLTLVDLCSDQVNMENR